ncbi:hypothetical protein [Hymenobacter sp. BT730]|uniref:hypothetical protein n=1 Tax=Hymenobacter sp. BT730 TaxID=3063332 RepID=UPI0026E04EE5|nr:hypothetical protein [Hymenobacter sp. BT730]
MKILFPLFTLLGIAGSHSLLAQSSSPADTVLLAQARQELASRYTKSLAKNASLYTGPEYLDYTKIYSKREGHQFFLSEQRQIGSVFYDGVQYEQVPLLYDTRLDQVITTLPDNPLNVRLNRSLVKHFTYADHRFIYLKPDSASASVAPTGFYDVVFADGIQLLAHRSKRMQEHPKQSGVEVEFTETDKYFLRKDNLLYPIQTKQSLLKVLRDKRRELQQFAREQKLSFQKDSREAAFLQLVEHYVSLRK